MDAVVVRNSSDFALGSGRLAREGPGTTIGLDTALWFFAAAVGLATPAFPELVGVSTAAILLGLFVIAFGTAGFLEHGGRYLTGAGIYTFTGGLFVGAGLLYYHRVSPGSITNLDIYKVGVWSFWANAAIYLFWFRRTRRLRASTVPRLSHQVTSFARTYALILLVLGLGMRYSSLPLGTGWQTIDAGATFDGAVLLAGSFIIGAKVRQPLWRVALSALALGLYIFTQFHNGSGRLVLADLALAFLILVQHRISLRRMKFVALGCIIPVLVVFALIGESRASGSPAANQAYGLTSVVSPVQIFGQEVSVSLDHGGIQPLVADATFFVPRSVHPTKYLGFNRVIAKALDPQLFAQTNGVQSFAALNAGEWYYIAGWAGIVLMVPFTGFAYLLIDRRLFARVHRLRSRSDLLLFFAFVLLAAAAPDLAWAGPDTWWPRTLPRLLLLIPGALWIMVTPRKASRVPTSVRDPRDAGVEPRSRQGSPLASHV